MKEVKATKFTLVDAAGKPRATLATDDDGASFLQFLDVRGNSTIHIGTDAKGATTFSLHKAKSEGGMAFVVQPDESSSLLFSDSEGRVRAMLSVSPEGRSNLSLHDGKEEVRAQLCLGTDGTPSLHFSDVDGEIRALFTMTADGSSKLVFSDATGTPRAIFGTTLSETVDLLKVDEVGKPLGVVPDNSVGLSYFDSKGEVRAFIVMNEDGAPLIRLFDADGNELWQAP